MVISFLVGNGFDIASGLRTSYSSFYDWYCKQPSKKSHIEIFKRDIINDIDNGGKNWADFEIGLGRYTARFSTETIGDFIDCYEDAQRGIIEYLKRETARYSNSISEIGLRKLRESVAKFYQEVSPAGIAKIESIFNADEHNNSIIHIVSFNYTGLIDRCAEALSERSLREWSYGSAVRRLSVSKTVVHIHGTSEEFPILGVNDPTQIANQELLSVPYFSEMLIKPKGVEATGQLWHTQAESIINSSRIICILGMSLGDSDSRWWQLIMNWIISNMNNHLIIFWHTDVEVDRISVFRYAREIAEVKAKITHYSNYGSDIIQSINERIHIVFNSKQFLRVEFESPTIEAVFG